MEKRPQSVCGKFSETLQSSSKCHCTCSCHNNRSVLTYTQWVLDLQYTNCDWPCHGNSGCSEKECVVTFLTNINCKLDAQKEINSTFFADLHHDNLYCCILTLIYLRFGLQSNPILCLRGPDDLSKRVLKIVRWSSSCKQSCGTCGSDFLQLMDHSR